MGDAGLREADDEPPFPLTEIDKWILSQTDEEFKKHDWHDLKNVIGKVPQRTQNL